MTEHQDGIPSELNSPNYPYTEFLRNRGWKYAEEPQRVAAYLRELVVRSGRILNEEEFLAETGTQYAEAARQLYPKLSAMARAGMISVWTLMDYARHLWCMKNPAALISVEIGPKQWAVNSCDTEIPEERAKEIVCTLWGFDTARVQIQEPAYYEATDWNYIRFRCGPINWVMHDDELDKIYD